VLMCGAALVMLLLGRRMDQQYTVTRRFDQKLERRRVKNQKARRFMPLQWGYQLLQRAGLERRPTYLYGCIVIFSLVCGTAFLTKGAAALLIAILAFALGTYIFIVWRAATTHQTLLRQLPGFIDHLIRIMAIGRSFDSALLHAIDDSLSPLSEAMEGVKLEHSLGGDLAESLQEVAEIYRMQELHLITLALRINQRYGGSIKAMLENIITLIRQREQAERELKALTGETRLSAWMLGCMPVAMAGYMMLVNPTYIGYLLADPHGMEIIYTSVGLQVVGGLILWRLMRSIR
ncbi:MAG: type II secretion system F family protein, partial [Methylomonas sp.]